MLNLNDCPDEVLEFIFSHLPPYNDLESCKLVCKRWNQIIHGMLEMLFRVNRNLCTFNHRNSSINPLHILSKHRR